MFPRQESKEVSLRPKTVFKWLVRTALVLLALNVVVLILKLGFNYDNFLVNAGYFFFDASREGNIPTLFSVLILFIASLNLGFIYVTRTGPANLRMYWLVLCIIFAWLTMDEAATIHEQFNKFRGVVDDQSGLLYYTWIIPYAIIAVAAAMFFMKFLLRLPARTRNLFVISGITYVGAALGFEIIEGYSASRIGVGNLQDKILCTTEEFLEMSGIIIFNYALLDYLAAARPKMRIVPG